MSAEATLSSVLSAAARQWGDQPVLVCERRDQRATFAELDALADAVACLLRERGVGPGDRVGVMFRNDLEFPACWLGIVRAGAAMVPLNVRLAGPDLGQLLASARPSLVLADAEFAAVLAAAGWAEPVFVTVEQLHALGGEVPAEQAGPWPETTANVQFTSGSTGLSKGCLLSHRFWLAIGAAMCRSGPRLNGDDVLLCAQQFSYMDPQWNLVVALLTGARLVVLERFRSDTFWPAVQRHGATFFYCLGVMPAMLLRTPEVPGERESSVRYVACSAIPKGRHEELERRFGAPWFELYGSTETGLDALVEPDDHDLALQTGTIGRPAPNREVLVVDEEGHPLPRGEVGRLLVRGAGMSDGYLDGAAGSVWGNGWYVTGDLAAWAQDGWLYFHGREKDIIRRSAENISAAQVEEAVQTSPDVRVCACVPVADELRGEEIKAYVVPVAAAAVDLAALVAHARSRLASFKVPRYWEVRGELPLTPSEKVAKAELRTEPEEQLGDCYDAVEQRWVGRVRPLPTAAARQGTAPPGTAPPG